MLPSELLEQGWCQDVLRDYQGKRCLVGAGIDGLGFETYSEFHKTITQILELPSHGMTIPEWNNASERTKAEVVAVAKLAEIKMGLRPTESGDVESDDGKDSDLQTLLADSNGGRTEVSRNVPVLR